MSLLDMLTCRLKCEYLSDLRHLNHLKRTQLIHELNNIPADAATLGEWNDALHYLLCAPEEEKEEAARQKLIRLLSEQLENGSLLQRVSKKEIADDLT